MTEVQRYVVYLIDIQLSVWKIDTEICICYKLTLFLISLEWYYYVTYKQEVEEEEDEEDEEEEGISNTKIEKRAKHRGLQLPEERKGHRDNQETSSFNYYNITG